MSKLDDLCAIKIMDWAMNIEMFPGGLEYAVWVNVKDNSPTFYYDHISQSIWRDPQFEPIASKQWRPSVDLNDALVCLERAFWKDGKKQFWFFKYWKGGYSCGPLSSEWAVTAVEPQIAMCLCALRAMGVPESEIQEATK